MATKVLQVAARASPDSHCRIAFSDNIECKSRTGTVDSRRRRYRGVMQVFGKRTLKSVSGVTRQRFRKRRTTPYPDTTYDMRLSYVKPSRLGFRSIDFRQIAGVCDRSPSASTDRSFQLRYLLDRQQDAIPMGISIP